MYTFSKQYEKKIKCYHGLIDKYSIINEINDKLQQLLCPLGEIENILQINIFLLGNNLCLKKLLFCISSKTKHFRLLYI